jgi:hypothetical protein
MCLKTSAEERIFRPNWKEDKTGENCLIRNLILIFITYYGALIKDETDRP